MGSEIDTVIIGDVAFDTKIENDKAVMSIGGGAYGAVLGAAYFSPNVGIVSAVGGDFDRTMLSSKGIDDQGLSILSGKQTPQFTITDFNGIRSVSLQNELLTSPSVINIPSKYLGARYFHLATSDPNRYLEWIPILKKLTQAKISIDAFEMYVRREPHALLTALAYSDLFFLNEVEYSTLKTQDEELFNIKPSVLKRGCLGASFHQGDTNLESELPESISAVDTTGAGDVLAGAFVSLLSQGLAISKSLNRAVKLASWSVTRYGLEHVTKELFKGLDE